MFRVYRWLAPALLALAFAGCVVSSTPDPTTVTPQAAPASPASSTPTPAPTLDQGPRTPTVAPDPAQVRETPSATPTEAELVAEAIRKERMEKGAPVLDKFIGADTGQWEINYYFDSDDFLTVSIHDSGGAAHDSRAYMRMVCATTGKLQISFMRHMAHLGQPVTRLSFRASDGKAVRDLHDLHNEWRTSTFSEWPDGRPIRPNSPGTVIHHVGDDNSRAVIDGMLLDSVSKVDAEFRGEGNDYTFDVTGFFAVHDILADYCRPPADEVQAAVAAAVLTPPTPTPVPSPTPTPARVSWQQEWCDEQAHPRYGLEGRYPLEGRAVGTARLIIRCGGGTLVVGIHITRSDGAYPESESGIAYTFGQGSKPTSPYLYHEEGWEQVRGSADEGVFLVLPEAAAKDVLEARYGPLPPNLLVRALWVLFDATGDDPRMREPQSAADLVVPLKRLAKEHPLD